MSRYLYAILPASPPLPQGDGMEGERLAYVGNGDLVLATQSWLADRDPLDPAHLQERLFRHHQVVAALMGATAALLPCSYGNLIPGSPPQADTRIRRWLRRFGGMLASQLVQVEGHEEYTLEVVVTDPLWRERLVPQEIGASAASPSPGLAYLQQVRRQRDGGRRYAEWLVALGDRIRRYLAASRLPFQEGRLANRDGEPALAYDLLLPRGRAMEVLEPLAALEREEPVLLRLSGPWAPFHFTRLPVLTPTAVDGKRGQ